MMVSQENIKEQMGELVLKYLELKFQTKLETLSHKIDKMESTMFNWGQRDSKEIDEIIVRLKRLEEK
jgi:hypothetical protein